MRARPHGPASAVLAATLLAPPRISVVLPGSAGAATAARPAAKAAAATTAPPAGQDVSWPQCPAGRGGYGLPMPGPRAAFVIIGLTAGRGFTSNPCVASQAAWAKTHGVRTAAYLVPTYPTRTQFRRWGSAGPARATSRQGRVYNVGWAQAADAVNVLRRSGLRASAVWIDIETNR